ncbi:hypothetical protein [Streptomyces phaeochromogenes]|uniref:hypothetical protein n=1 Tax=Streptomyces phaeochromogenes TaxID=1923 RepID=UPI002DDBE1DA|nr:hypothetical protein [Streptomyces phaeochromogenes]WRZ30213.1 hypothetical protein OG931_21910 [Streptomyces phaeochromogenes]
MTQPDFTSPLAGAIEVRTLCPYCPPPAMFPRTLMAEHITDAHPDKSALFREEQLAEAADALYAIGKACLVVKGTLDVPYQDDPRWTPWTRWVAKPARTAYNLGFLLRRRHSKTPGSRAHLTPTAATRLYDAARGLADATVGHTDACEWHTNGHAYCSCPAYGAACAGVDAVLEALAAADTADGTT